MKRLLIILTLLALSGCQSITLNILSNNNILTTRSQATGAGDQEALVEGGGSPNVDVSAAGL
jgi:uncharacterized protein YceK